MTTLHATTPSRALFGPSDIRGKSNRVLVFAAALYIALAIAGLTIVAIAARSLGDIGVLYGTVT